MNAYCRQQHVYINVGGKANKITTNVGLDLRLFAISDKAKFVLEKVRLSINYANDFDKIQDMDNLELHLKMVQTNPDGTPEYILKELIEDSEIVLSFYPNRKADKYQFQSLTRGYETLNYLLTEYLKDNHISIKKEKIFYSGTDIFANSQLQGLQYLDLSQTLEIYNLLKPVDFSSLVKFYDYEKMRNLVYKLTRPENLDHLKAEFERLKIFFKEATELKSFVVIKMS